jgi:hypothetical protein
MQSLTLASKLRLQPDVVMQEVAGESVILNLATEQYYGLDEVGTFMLAALGREGTAQQVYESTLAAFDVAGPTLQQDLLDLFMDLVRHGLLQTVR